MPILLFLQGAMALSLAANPTSATQRAAQDSATTVRQLRGAQRTLEWQRRVTLPVEPGGASGGTCDVRIGPYCYWVDDRREQAPTERPAFVRARAAFIVRLDSAAAAHPGDLWIAAARVRYLAESGDNARAVAAARGCRDRSGWCAALTGYALHLAGHYAAADSAFVAARARLPDKVRCDWSDLRPLLPTAVTDAWRRASCARRDSLADDVWWLATPLFLTGANDLRTEYYARRTRAWIERNESSAQFLWWDDYIEELWARYGWPTWLTRVEPPAGSLQDASIVGHDPTPSFAFLPAAESWRAPLRASEAAWADPQDHQARMRYAPRWLLSLDGVRHQFARFRRGDSLLVVASYDVTQDSAFHDASPLSAGLFAGPSAQSMRGVTRVGAPRRGTLCLTMPDDSALLSLEVLSPDDSAARRARRGVAPIDGPVSDLLLFEPRADSSPSLPTLEEVAASALPSNSVARSHPLGVYWEAYLPAADTLPARISLTLEPVGASWLRRTLWRAGLGTRASAVRLRWQGRRGAGAAGGQSIVLHLDELRPGSYRVTVTVDGQHSSGSATRTLVLR